MDILFIDCYDSYTWNVYRLLKSSDPDRDCRVHTIHHDQLSLESISSLLNCFSAVVISPGPGSPVEYSDILSAIWLHEPPIPIFGICLGFQSMCVAYGCKINQLGLPMHGISSDISFLSKDIFDGISSLKGMRYHSLYCEDINDSVIPLCWASDGIIMGAMHNSRPHRSVLFHPESIGSTNGEKVISNFYKIADDYNRNRTLESISTAFWDNFDIRPRPLYSIQQKAQLLGTRPSISQIKKRRVLYKERNFDPLLLEDFLFACNTDNDSIIRQMTGNDTKRPWNGFCKTSNFVYFRSAVTKTERWSIFCDTSGPACEIIKFFPRDNIISVHSSSGVLKREVKDDFWKFVAEYHAVQGSYESELSDIPFIGGFLGCIGYCVSAMNGYQSDKVGNEPHSVLLFADRSVLFDHKYHRVIFQSISLEDEHWLDHCDASLNEFDEHIRSKLSCDENHSSYQEPKEETRFSNSTEDQQYNVSEIVYPDRTEYISKILSAQNHLHMGDSYEICLTGITDIKFSKNANIDSVEAADTLRENRLPLHLFQKILKFNPSPYMSLICVNGTNVIGGSPERFMTAENGQCLFRPMKGTLKKARYSYEEACRILENQKDRAELDIISDLIRNDVHIVADPIDSVTVAEGARVQTFEKVYQLVCDIAGRIKEPFSSWDVLSHSLPPGSMTGAPKKRTLEIIDKLEDKMRGIYSGVIGYWSLHNDKCDWSVVIRSLYQFENDDRMHWHIGAGGAITVLSDPDAEWEEMKTKLSSVIPAFLPEQSSYVKGNNTIKIELREELLKHGVKLKNFGLLETTLVRFCKSENDDKNICAIKLFDKHIERLRKSALMLNFPWPGGNVLKMIVNNRIKEEISKLRKEAADNDWLRGQNLDNGRTKFQDDFDAEVPSALCKCYKLRFVLNLDSTVLATVTEFDSNTSNWKIRLDTRPAPSRSMLFSHKTTVRSHYQDALERVGSNLTSDPPSDCLLFNEQGFVTECTISNVAFNRHGKWVTPRLSHGIAMINYKRSNILGMLAGIKREELLEQVAIEEGDIRVSDLKPGEKIMLFNSLRQCYYGEIVV